MAEDRDDSQEKTQDPTQRRLDKAREEFKYYMETYKWWMSLIPGFLFTYMVVKKVKNIKQEYEDLN